MKNKGVSGEALKMAAAMLLAFAIFVMLVGFAMGPKEADSQAAVMGEQILNYTQDAALKILE